MNLDNVILPELSDLFAQRFKLGDFSFITDTPDGKTHEKQKIALEILTDKITKEFCYGGAAGGAKSWTGCAWLAFMCKNYPGTKWFIGREELKRLRDSTMVTFRKVCKKYSIKDWTYNGQDHFIQFANGSRIDLLDLKYLPSDPLYERYGSAEFTGGWIEEAGETNFGAYDTLKSRVGRHLNDLYGLVRKIFITCNPKKNWLYNVFYKPFKEGVLLPIQKFVQALVQDNPFRESDYEEALLSISDQSKKERLYYGNWDYEDDPAILMEYQHIAACFINSHIKGGKKYITVDVARFGSDKTMIFVWDGLRVVEIKKLEKKKVTEVNSAIIELQKKYQVSKANTIADEDGIGGGVVDLNGCLGFLNNSKPINTASSETYANLRAQCYYKLAELINAGLIYILVSGHEEQELISQELGAIKKKDPDSDEKKANIISREDIKNLIGRSPDYASALMMRMRFEISSMSGRLKSSYEEY